MAPVSAVWRGPPVPNPSDTTAMIQAATITYSNDTTPSWSVLRRFTASRVLMDRKSVAEGHLLNVKGCGHRNRSLVPNRMRTSGVKPHKLRRATAVWYQTGCPPLGLSRPNCGGELRADRGNGAGQRRLERPTSTEPK